MKVPYPGAIDCDLHLAIPPMSALLPYLDEFWREQLVTRYIDRNTFQLQSYPPGSPFSARADHKAAGKPGANLDSLRRDALDPYGTEIAVCSVLHGAIALFNEDMAAAIVSAVNDWMAEHWLAREPRLRGTILLPAQNVDLAVREIERVAADRRFVQVLLLAMGDAPLGKRGYWPIYAAAERHGLAVCIHAGSLYRYPPTYSGWPSYQVEDYLAQGPAFESQLVSMLAEGVFQKFPKLRVILAESGFTWLPTLLWRVNKSWRAVRPEVPWIDREPSEIIREHVRFTLQPLDLPKDRLELLERIFAHAGSEDLLLFSTDYPHWHFDGEDALPDGLSDALVRKILIDNPRAAFPRLGGAGLSGSGAPNTEETVP